MRNRRRIGGQIAVLGVLGLIAGCAGGERTPLGAHVQPEVLAFDDLSLRVEVNETDEDREVVVQVAAFEGLRELRLIDPSGTLVLHHLAGPGSTGIGDLALQTAEGEIASFPEGVFTVEGVTASGATLRGEALLTYDALPAPTGLSPTGAAPVAPGALTVSWDRGAGAAAYVLEIEHDDLGLNLTVRLPPATTSFAIPAGLLQPATEYEVSIGTLADNGNLSESEGTFVTAP